MVSLDLAIRLKAAGVGWLPANGDRFAIPNRELDDEVFVVSDMVVEVHDVLGGKVMGFNGTTEWALDSIPAGDVVWLPREDQLRDLLGADFVRLEALEGGWVVVLADGSRHVDIEPDRAYAHAVLHVRAA